MKLNRRQFCSVALTASAVLAQNAPPPLIDRGFARVSKLADGVYVTIAKNGPQCVSNGGFIVGRDRVLLLEGHFQPAGAALEPARIQNRRIQDGTRSPDRAGDGAECPP